MHADGSVTPGATWNPLRAKNPATGKLGHHCVKISPACLHCYAWRQNKWTGTGLDYSASSPAETYLDEQALTLPLRWRRPRKIFVCSMTDLFGDWVSDEQIDRLFAVMALANRHTFQVLTKRPERMLRYIGSPNLVGDINGRSWRIREAGHALGVPIGDDVNFALPLPNVWLGVTIEDHERLERLEPLLQTPAAIRFVSAEPLLGSIDLGLRNWAHIGERRDDCRIDWVIVGGESGAGARPMHPDWARLIRDDCQAAGVPFFFKQWGEWAPENDTPTTAQRNGWGMYRVGKQAAGRLLDGREWSEFPAAAHVSGLTPQA